MLGARFDCQTLTRVLTAWALLTCVCTSPAAQLQERRTSLEAVSWEVGEGRHAQTVHGIAAEGFSLDMRGVEGPRAVRALLMPIGWTAEPNHEEARLKFTIGRRQVGNSAHQVIDIEFGAALIELQPAAAARILAVVPEMRRAALRVVQREDPGPEMPVPQLAEGFGEAVERFVKSKQEGPEALSAQDAINRASAQEIYTEFISFWPMIITRSITAGAEGTDALVLALPDEHGAEHTFVCFSKFLNGSNFQMTSANGHFPNLKAGQHLCVRIVQEPGKPIEIDPGQPRNTDTDVLAWAYQTLCEGWSEVFSEACPSADEAPAGDAGNNAP